VERLFKGEAYRLTGYGIHLDRNFGFYTICQLVAFRLTGFGILGQFSDVIFQSQKTN
jgi:hypothetical protein